MFTVEPGANGWRVVNEYGYIAAARIPAYELAQQTATAFEADPNLARGHIRWHKRKTEAGPTRLKRPMKVGKRRYTADVQPRPKGKRSR